MRSTILALTSVALLFIALQLSAQELPRCLQRSTVVELPRVEGVLWCLERPVHESEAGALAFTAIAFAPDGVSLRANGFD